MRLNLSQSAVRLNLSQSAVRLNLSLSAVGLNPSQAAVGLILSQAAGGQNLFTLVDRRLLRLVQTIHSLLGCLQKKMRRWSGTQVYMIWIQ